MNDFIRPGIQKYIQSTWHTEKYLTEDVDLFFRLHSVVLEAVFNKYASMGKGPMDRLCLHEFRMMCNEAGLCNETFVMREIDMCFRQAMMTEVDEILQGEHLQMVYVEFIEALARVADESVPDKAGVQITLRKKLEIILPALMAVCPTRAKNGFEAPTEAHYHNMKYIKRLSVIQEFIPGT